MRTGPGARAADYPADISPFRAAVGPDDLGAWRELAALAGHRGSP
ncbi:hypothetical protein ABZV24_41940 [Streptomyces sp. NPDC005251]